MVIDWKKKKKELRFRDELKNSGYDQSSRWLDDDL